MQELQAKIKKLKEIETQLEKVIGLEESPQNKHDYILQLEQTRLERLHLELDEIST